MTISKFPTPDIVLLVHFVSLLGKEKAALNRECYQTLFIIFLSAKFLLGNFELMFTCSRSLYQHYSHDAVTVQVHTV